MFYTIFTPTHDPTWLAETWASVRDQPGEWEWLIGCNGACTPAQISAVVGVDPRVRILTLTDACGVGDLKRRLCEAATGEVLVELDHDDVLAPGALHELEIVFEKHPDVGFVFSDFAEFEETTGAPFVYSGSGWAVGQPTDIRGRHLVPMRAFEPSARSLCQILFAPNHVRAWRRSAYFEAGGHDPSLVVCDDFDLMCRTYLVTRMHHLPRCLYVYRRRADGANTWLTHNAEIQRMCGRGADLSLPDCAQQMPLRDRYLHRLVLREAQLRGLGAVDLGGGLNGAAGFQTLDVRPSADVVHDVFATRRLPYNDNSVFVFRAFDFLEHGADDDAIWLMDEIYRCLAPGGWLLSLTPHADGLGAHCDPTHKARWSERRLLYWCHEDLHVYLPSRLQPHARFQPVRLFTETLSLGPSPWHFAVPYVVADLLALKGQASPGFTYFRH